VTASTSHTEPAVSINAEAHSGTPTRRRPSAHWFDNDIKIKARDTAKLVGHDIGLPTTLELRSGKEQIAATATARVRVGADNVHPPGRGPLDLDRVGAQEAPTLARSRDHNIDHFTRKCVPRKHDATVRVAGHGNALGTWSQHLQVGNDGPDFWCCGGYGLLIIGHRSTLCGPLT
jgi:hypothetical protein